MTPNTTPILGSPSTISFHGANCCAASLWRRAVRIGCQQAARDGHPAGLGVSIVCCLTGAHVGRAAGAGGRRRCQRAAANQPALQDERAPLGSAPLVSGRVALRRTSAFESGS
eukprot:1011790-Prymnesium_polylepis.1